MPTSSTIAVIIPTYNRRAMLARALDSVYTQTRQPDEVCVVDDGSIDDTPEFIEEHYPAVNYIYQTNRGVSAARNTGVRGTHSDWIAFLDSDDEWLPTKLEKQETALLNNPDYRLVHCDEIWIRNGVRVNPRIKYLKEGGDIFMRCLNLCAMAPSAVIMQRSLFEELRGFEESLPACEDYDMWLKVCSRNPVLYVDKQLLTKYGGHEDQLSTQHWGMDRFRVQALNRLLGSDVLGDEKYAAARSVLIEKCEILRLGALKRKNQRMAWQYRNLMEKFPAREGSQSDA